MFLTCSYVLRYLSLNVILSRVHTHQIACNALVFTFPYHFEMLLGALSMALSWTTDKSPTTLTLSVAFLPVH